MFVFIAIITIISSFFMVEAIGATSIFVLIIIIAFFGVPHGSLDTLFAHKGFALITLVDWFKFIGIYMSISLGVLIFWLYLPTIFFIIFLFCSALHFSDDLVNHTSKVLSILYGFNIILLPSILYSNELANLYGNLIDISYSISIVKVMWTLAIASLIITSVTCMNFFIKKELVVDKRQLLETVIVGLLFFSVEPLCAFTIYFCFMHSARHILRAKFYFDDYSSKALLLTLIVPTVIVVIFCSLYFQILPSGNLNENLIKVTFIALAALTFPHSFLLTKVGFLKWVKLNS
jgi:Brp/Blh family beta-carotene 15,15'-monooxygenase